METAVHRTQAMILAASQKKLDVYAICIYFKSMVEALGARIKRLRQERELTLQAVANELGLTPAAISHWESGRITPKPRKLQELARALKVSVGTLSGSTLQSARSQQAPMMDIEPMTDIDRIISDAQEEIAKKIGCSPHRVRLILTIEPN